jgi:hypothetical protein
MRGAISQKAAEKKTKRRRPVSGQNRRNKSPAANAAVALTVCRNETSFTLSGTIRGRRWIVSHEADAVHGTSVPGPPRICPDSVSEKRQRPIEMGTPVDRTKMPSQQALSNAPTPRWLAPRCQESDL